MKLLFAVVSLCLSAVSGVAQDRPLTADERSFLIQHFERTLSIFDKTIDRVSPAQAAFKENDARWSVLEIAEHLASTEDMLFGYATKTVLAMPSKPEVTGRTAEAMRQEDEKVLSTIVDRSGKAQAPEPTRPASRYKTLPEAGAALHEKRAKVIQYIRTTQDPLRQHGAAGPGGKIYDAYQYLLLLAAHTERHCLQMAEVKAATGYPK